MRALNPATPHLGLQASPTYCDLPSCRSASNHVMCPHIALTATAACTVISRLHPNVGGSPAHPAESSSSSCRPTVCFRLLPTPSRLTATQLPSATELWYTPTWTCTMLINRHHGRTTKPLRGSFSSVFPTSF